MNAANSDSLATSVSSGHRDPKTLMGYVTKGPSLKMKGARSISAELSTSDRAAKRKRDDETLADKEDSVGSFFEDENEENEA
jgi:hypothetical protein